ncbi:MAG: ATP-dependent DNA helicase [Nitrospiraceae bacterium]|nr:ATP-dependent DNA helicase [Nitrospiraceae bacterium]
MENIISLGPGNTMLSDLKRDSERFFSEDVASAMAGYEIRLPQVKMMSACAKNIERGGTLVVEAGTGTGKTFAYLVPAILSGKKAIVSTRTINLQEQLAHKDLKFLSSLLEFDYAIAKGRGQYLCLRRLHAFHPENEEEMAEQEAMINWATDTGDIEDYHQHKKPLIWDRICSDSEACKGKNCSYKKNCYYFAARRNWESVNVTVVNHALLAVNAMMPDDKKILPNAEILVIDEGHTLDGVISEQAGINLSDRGMDNLLNRLLKVDQKGVYKGLLSRSPFIFAGIESLRAEAAILWSKAKNLENRRIIQGATILRGNLLALAGAIRGLIEKMRTTPLGIFTEDEALELNAAISKLRSFAGEMEIFSEEKEGFVRWAEVEGKRTGLRMSPVYPSHFVKTRFIPNYKSVILTSATLADSGDFSLIENILGLENPEKLSIPSPFDIKNQVRIEIKKGISLQREDGIERLAQVIVQESTKEAGGTLVLFTSREIMKKAWDMASEELVLAGLNPMMQGDLPNRTMLDVMRESKDAVIFGLDSFWEGVDVKGDSLNCLIITKLPFEVPTEPFAAARTAEIKKSGGNPFREYSVPRAVLKFKQGFGRLIRSKEDRGRVIICDDRIETKDYGHRFLNSVFK